MPIIDARGRVFGRMNVFDAGVALAAIATLALAGVGYRLLKVPLPPRVTAVSPNRFAEAPSLRIVIKGENLVPYMHVYVRRSGEPMTMMHDPLRWVRSDAYTPANSARTVFRLESPTLGEVDTIDQLLPGSYDLVFKDETQVVGAAENAFTVVPAPTLSVASQYRETIVRVDGAFVGLDPDQASHVKNGEAIPTGAADATELWGTVVSIGAQRPDVAKVDVGGSTIDAPITGRVAIPATMRLRCTLQRGGCYTMDQQLIIGQTIKLQVGGAVREFVIQKISPENSTR